MSENAAKRAGGAGTADAQSAFDDAQSAYEEAVRAIPPGRYRHFKGRMYEVLCIARHSETLAPMVVYRALYGEHGVWVRPASMWSERVERDGGVFRRFTRVEDCAAAPAQDAEP